jgi:leader peptidase (prepilin peptidase)/N-methyltransferase
VSPLLITSLSLGLAGLAAAPAQRAVIFRLAVPAGEPARRHCPACHGQAVPARRPPRPPLSLPARWPPLSPPARWPPLSPSGRCPACRHRTGPPPLTVEVATAILLAGLGARVHPGLVLAAACWLALCAVPLAFIDVAVNRLPDALTAPAYAGTALLLLLAAAVAGHWGDLARAMLGGVALAGFCLALVLISPSGMGLGDVKAAASLGTLLAWPGWTSLAAGAFAGFGLAGLYGAALLISGRATRKQHIPFGPFVIAGAFAVILAHGVGP